MYESVLVKFIHEGGSFYVIFIKTPRHFPVPTIVGNAADYSEQCCRLWWAVLPTIVSTKKQRIKNPGTNLQSCSGIFLL